MEPKLMQAIAGRHSPRSFSDKRLTQEQLRLLFEAARWAPSSNNEQEWSYYYATSDFPDAHKLLCSCLFESNRIWAERAPVVIVSCGRKLFGATGKLNRHWMHDVGAANVSMALQAEWMGLALHQMAGFSVDRCAQMLELNMEEVEPVTMMVAGYQDGADVLPDELQKRELQPRVRKELEEFVYELK